MKAIDRAIERIEEEIEEFDEDSRVLGLYRALDILKEEAKKPDPTHLRAWKSGVSVGRKMPEGDRE